MASRLTDMEIDDYRSQGHQLYRQKRYQAALQRFNAVNKRDRGVTVEAVVDVRQIINQERKPSLNILDNRAATYAKLGNLQAALRDGRSMIQDRRTSCSVRRFMTAVFESI